MPKQILIAGATGLIGKYLVKALLAQGDDVIVATRSETAAREILPGIRRIVEWNNLNSLKGDLIEGVINLAGMNLDEKRWNKRVKKSIYDSRINSTQRIVQLISSMNKKPEFLVNASGVDYYGDKGDRNVYEDSPPGDLFTSRLVVDWEKAALEAEKSGVRVVLMRTGFVVARDSNAFRKMILPFKLFAGGYASSGKQYMSWIHIKDLVRVYLLAIENRQIRGALNACSPNPETMKQFAKHTGTAMHRPSFFPAPRFLLRVLFGEVVEVLVSGRKALPQKLTQAGFKFDFDNAIDAIEDCV